MNIFITRLALDSGGAGAAVSGCSVDPVDASAGVSSRVLARPRLVVTGEVTGGRDVNDVVELNVVRVEPTG